MMRMSNGLISCPPVLAALFLLAVGAGSSGCGAGKGEKAGPPKRKVPAVTVAVVREEPISRLLRLTGETVVVESVVLSSTVEGPISFCPWREGDRVEVASDRPTRLIEIDRELYRAEVKAAEAALEVAEAKLADMRAGTRPEEIARVRQEVRQLEESESFTGTDLERIEKLVRSGSLPGEALEKARVEHVAAEAGLAAAKRNLEMLEAGFTRTAIAIQEAVVKEAGARLDLANARSSECVIHAPFPGTVTRVHVRSGDMAAPGKPLLEMADLSTVTIRVAVPETYASRVHEGMIARMALDSLPGEEFTAGITRVYPELDRRMRTRTVELMPEEPAELVPGMFARVALVLESVPNVLTVPGEAVRLTPAGTKATFIVAGGKACLRKVRTGIEQGGRIQILAGLASGEKVVVSGQEKLKDGVDVRVVKPGKGTGRPGAAPDGPASGKDGMP